MQTKLAVSALAALPVIAAVAFGNPANASAANQNKPSVQHTGQQCNPLRINYSMEISAVNGENQVQKVTLPACTTPPQITLRIPDTSATVRYSPAITGKTQPPKEEEMENQYRDGLTTGLFFGASVGAAGVLALTRHGRGR